MTKLKLTAAAALSAALLLPLAIFAGTGFAHGSPSSSEYEYGGGKVTICHKAGKSGKSVTVNVSKSAAKSFLRRGDTAGPCAGGSKEHGASKHEDATTTTTTTTTTARTEDGHGKSEDEHGKSGDEHGKSESQSHGGGNDKHR